MTPRAWCVVPAAGSGQRFGGALAKQFIEVDGKSILMHSLEALARHASVDGIVVALSNPADMDLPQEILGKPLLRCKGGSTRAASVLTGLNALPGDVDSDALVLVHDAARPNLHSADISSLLEVASTSPSGALLALPVSDTLKQSNANAEVECTVPRERFWRALTPQCFTRKALTDALFKAAKAGIEITDESMAMELAGFSPKLVAGRADNLKITTQPDLQWFRTQLALRAGRV